MLRRLVTGHGWNIRTLKEGAVITVDTHQATAWCLQGWAEPVEERKIP